MSVGCDLVGGARDDPALSRHQEELEGGVADPAVNALARRRIGAYALDMAGCAGIAVCTIPLGLLVRGTRWAGNPSATLRLSVAPVLLATCAAALAESRGATYGKRRCGLRVVRVDGGRLSLRRALLRNTVKIALPWHLGHVVAIAAASGQGAGPHRRVAAAATITYSLQVAALAGVLSGRGRTLHDLVSGSRVVALATTRPSS